MKASDTRQDYHYIHGTAPDEQERLSRLNDLINDRSLREMNLAAGERAIDIGSGLGQLTRAMARQVGAGGANDRCGAQHGSAGGSATVGRTRR